MKYLAMRHIISTTFAGFSAFYLVPLMIRIASKWGIMDYPDGVIKTQKQGVAYLGGLALYISFIASLALFYPFHNTALWFLLGTTLLLFVGLIDDLIILKPHQKALGLVIAIICFLKGGVALKADFFSELSNLFLSLFWMFLVINAFNLIDVMDGLSTLVAIIAASSFFCVALLSHNYAVSLLLITFISPLIVFFFYNKPPAKIYMGDCGSLFIGGFLSAMPFFLSWGTFSPYGYIIPLVILAIPLGEVFYLVLLRTYEGIPFYHGSPHHFSIIFQKKGWAKSKILIFTGINGSILGGSSLLFLLNYLTIIPFCSIVFTVFSLFSFFILMK